MLFAAGMSLFDTIDGCFMNFAYDWAFAKPVRKVYYNLTITGLSVFVALFIGTIELLGPVRPGHQPERLVLGRSWRTSTSTRPGFVIVGVFVVDLDRRPGRLALRPHRAEVGHPPGCHRRHARTERNQATRWLNVTGPGQRVAGALRSLGLGKANLQWSERAAAPDRLRSRPIR